jgi:hypothetical protein
MSEEAIIGDRKYNFEYKEQTSRTIIAISSAEISDDQDVDLVMRLHELLALSQTVVVDSNPELSRMLFVQKVDPKGNAVSVPIEELRAIVKACLKEL